MDDKIKDIALDAIVKYFGSEAWIFTDDELVTFGKTIIETCINLCLNDNDKNNIKNYWNN